MAQFITLTPASFDFIPCFRFSRSLLFLIVCSRLFTSSNAFTWRWTTAPVQCESTSVIWQGGSPPYTILLLPIGFLPQGEETRVIFEKTVTTGNKVAFNFPFPASSKFVAVLSDLNGFGSGGTSAILTVASSNTSSCLPTSPSSPEFYLYLSSTSLAQCQTIHISWDTPTNPPATVYGVIPQGQSFDLNAASHANGGDGFNWTINVRSGTQFFFVAGDGNGAGKGGSTDVQSIGSGSSGCISLTSPSSTPDSGVGSVGSLPTASGTGTATVTQTAGGDTGSGSGGRNGSGSGNGNTSSGSGSGDGSGGGGDNGSGGGTVHGPSDPTIVANSDSNSPFSKNRIILALVISLTGVGVLVGLGFIFYKRTKRQNNRRDNQRTRLLLADDISDRDSLGHTDLPHPRPAFSSRAWASGSVESLGSGLRVNPFIWPLRNGSGTPSMSPLERIHEWKERDAGYAGETSTPEDGPGLGAMGTSTARPQIQDRSTSSGLLRRLRSVRYAGSGMGFPYRGGSGYRSLGEGENSTPSGQAQHPANISDSNVSVNGVPCHSASNSEQSGSSSMESHKSPLPPSYAQHASQSSHGSNFSRFSGPDPSPFQRSGLNFALGETDGLLHRGSNLDPQTLGVQEETSTQPVPTPVGARPPPGPSRPSMGRTNTGGSIWEVPPTYASLARRRE